MLSIKRKTAGFGLTLIVLMIALTGGFFSLQKPQTIQNRASEGASITCSWTTSIPDEYTFDIKLVDPQGVLLRQATFSKKIESEDQISTYKFVGLTQTEMASTACQIGLVNNICPNYQSEQYTCKQESPTPTIPEVTVLPSISVTQAPSGTITPTAGPSPTFGPSPTGGPSVTVTGNPSSTPPVTIPPVSCPQTKLDVHIDCLNCSQ